jgi:TatA/E family protein of Tat protein translocase
MPVPGPLELVVILVIALLILGPGRLPDVGSALGKSLREFRKAASDVQEAARIDVSPLPATPTTPPAAPAAEAAPPAAPPAEAAPPAAPPAEAAPPAAPPAEAAAPAAAAEPAAAEPVASTGQPDAESAS